MNGKRLYDPICLLTQWENKMEKIEISCLVCDADYKVCHDLNKPYKPIFCAFCGEDIEEDLVEWEDDESDNWIEEE